MRSRNRRQIGIALLLAGSLIIAMVAGFGLALLASQLGAQRALPAAGAPSAQAGVIVIPAPQQPAASPDRAEPAAASAEASQVAEPDLVLPQITPEAGIEAGGAPLLEDTFDSAASGWLERETPEWSAAYRAGQYRLALTGQPTIGVSAVLPADSYRVTVDVTVSQGAGGLIFLAAQPDIFYRFMLNLDGMYAIEAQHQDQSAVTYAVDWTYSDILQRPAGATYRVRVERQGALVRFWVNDEPLTSWAVPQGATTNQYGFAVSSPDGQAEAAFDNLVGARLTDGDSQ